MKPQPVPATARSTAWVCVRSPDGVVGSIPTGSMDVCSECCARRTDHSSRGVLPTVVRRCV